MSQVAKDAWAELCATDAKLQSRGKGKDATCTVTHVEDKALRELMSGRGLNKENRKKKSKAKKGKVKAKPRKSEREEGKEEECAISEVRTEEGARVERKVESGSFPEQALKDPNMLIRILQRDISLIGSDDVSKRKQSLERLSLMLFGNGSSSLDVDVLESVFGELQKPLLRRLSDPSEKCRELSITLLIKFLGVCQDLGRVLPYLFPALMERNSQTFIFNYEANEMIRDDGAFEAKQRGKSVPLPNAGTTYQHQVSEPSEEIRLLLCQMLGTLVDSLLSRDLHSMLGPYFHDTIMFFHACAVDPFPTLRMEGLKSLQSLAEQPKYNNTMHHYCTALVRSVMPSLRHRQSRVRICTLHAIRALVACPYQGKCKGGGTEAIADLVGYREDNVIPICAFYQGETRINYFGSVVTDPQVTVRVAFFEVLSSWMTTLLDRWDHAGRLLPFLLSALSDDSDEIKQIGLKTLEELGRQYEEEHHDEIIEKKQYGIDGADDRINFDIPLPKPWTKRPGIGTRLYVRQHTRRFLSTILRELGDWKSTTRLRAIGLLHTTLVYSEESLTMELHLFVKTLLFLTNDPEIGPHVKKCANLAGRFVDPDAYLALLLPHVQGEEGTVGSSAESQWGGRIRAIVLLNNLLLGSKAKRILCHFVGLVAAVSQNELLRASRECESLRQVHEALVERILSTCMETGSRDALDAQFLATGRLNSLHQQYQLLVIVSLQLKSPGLFKASQRLLCERTSETGGADILKRYVNENLDSNKPVCWEMIDTFTEFSQETNADFDEWVAQLEAGARLEAESESVK
mmetsp:Transcript_11682/g.21301  ORF Transcript_11682/g.21301 Transcript_11682/m.21301 type:complete len:801 (-) Transcript_11682:26-2428(-)